MTTIAGATWLTNSTILVAVFLPMNFAAVAASFDCTKARAFAEKAVCSNAQLSRMDDALSDNYKHMLASNIGDGARDDLRKTQRQWLTDRNSCKTDVCLVELYRGRIDAICEYPVISGVHPGCIYSDSIK